MSRSAPSPEHQAALRRRLALLSGHLSDQLTVAHHPTDESILDTGPETDPGSTGEWWAEHTRLAEPRTLRLITEPGPDVGSAPEPVVVPVPGRHAARRDAGRLVGPGPSWLPDTLRGRVRLGATHVAVIALLVAVGLAVTCWRVVRDDPAPPEPVAAVVPAEPAAVTVPTTGQAVTGQVTGETPEAAAGVEALPVAAAASGTVTVDVAGRVRRPGIVVLDAGTRVVDALEAAGGARPAVDLTALNLARPLVDGEQILVGVEPPPGLPAVSSAGSPPVVAGGAPTLVDLNLAGEAELDTLPGVGPVTAAAILAWRDEHGGFTAVDELLEVSGIGDATLAELAPLVTV